MPRGNEPEVFGITSAQTSLTDDQSGRARRYFISMMARTGCFILAVITPSPWRWGFLIGAVFLPYFAVIFANATRGEQANQGALLAADAKALPPNLRED